MRPTSEELGIKKGDAEGGEIFSDQDVEEAIGRLDSVAVPIGEQIGAEKREDALKRQAAEELAGSEILAGRQIEALLQGSNFTDETFNRRFKGVQDLLDHMADVATKYNMDAVGQRIEAIRSRLEKVAAEHDRNAQKLAA